MTGRVHNFNPGPAALPLPVLEQVQSNLLDFAGTGMSILEMSHRSATYEELHNQAIADLRTLLGGTEDHAVLFMGGGAQMQFALVALNLLCPGFYAEYLVTGVWSETALSEARKIGDARVLWSSASTAHTRIPCRVNSTLRARQRMCTIPATTRSWARSIPMSRQHETSP